MGTIAGRGKKTGESSDPIVDISDRAVCGCDGFFEEAIRGTLEILYEVRSGLLIPIAHFIGGSCLYIPFDILFYSTGVEVSAFYCRTCF